MPADAVDYVVRAGAGSARDMESALDQVVVTGGLPDDGDALDELVEALCEHDTGRALMAVERAMDAGRSPRLLGEQLISRLRDVFLASMKMDLVRLPEHDRERVAAQAERLGAAGATRALEVLGEAFVGIQDAPDQRIPLEVALVRLTRPESDTSISALVDRVTRLEHAAPPAAGASSSPPPAPAASRPAPARRRARWSVRHRDPGGRDTRRRRARARRGRARVRRSPGRRRPPGPGRHQAGPRRLGRSSPVAERAVEGAGHADARSRRRAAAGVRQRADRERRCGGSRARGELLCAG